MHMIWGFELLAQVLGGLRQNQISRDTLSFIILIRNGLWSQIYGMGEFQQLLFVSWSFLMGLGGLILAQ